MAFLGFKVCITVAVNEDKTSIHRWLRYANTNAMLSTLCCPHLSFLLRLLMHILLLRLLHPLPSPSSLPKGLLGKGPSPLLKTACLPFCPEEGVLTLLAGLPPTRPGLLPTGEGLEGKLPLPPEK